MDLKFSLVYFCVMARNKSPADINEMIEILKARGFRVNREVTYVSKTVDIEKGLWDKIEPVRLKEDLTIRECVAQALQLWLEHVESKPDKV